ncbi:MAG: FAD-dependent monooxygenase [Rhodocyclaceae bacterium]|nr:FAD-dependent monooxygenase [Rhodocyclaceae bacterium]MDZ4214598.1 FAD-dependent monooxygenase [Rhodocyclaceae bacterium]
MNAPVLIIGGGPAGMALALALQRGGVRARIVDARPRGAAKSDARILALSHGSRLILESLGVWRGIPHTPIKTIHVSHQGGLGRTLIRAEEEQVPALGYVLASGDLAAALDAAVAAANIAYADNTPAPEHPDSLLTVHAEGRIDESADIRSRDYNQHAIICMARGSVPHGDIAWERFTPAGPVALLPCGEAYAVVLTCPATDSERFAGLSDADFLALLQARFGPRVKLVGVGPRLVYPLGLKLRKTTVGERAVWIGNAAQTLHPVAGQGFNLALRDIAELADTLTDASDPGDASLLARYAARRRVDRATTIGFTDGLVRLFSNDLSPLRHLRGAGLLALDLFPPARSFLARRMMFGGRGW